MAWTRTRFYEALKTILAAITGRDPADIQAKTTLIEELRFAGARALRALAARLEAEFAALGVELAIDRHAIAGVADVWALAGLLEKSRAGEGTSTGARALRRGPAPATSGAREPRPPRTRRPARPSPRKPRAPRGGRPR